ncbi:alpha-amylase family glycosyl hydrolase [Effusibacillus consociatus]|uniref:Alpha-amylase family glycosyl hydrolase n=1 Tax=Effusibacillus consociatus TaxID=1117041 RepID=A0ABV9PWE5_9BACL
MEGLRKKLDYLNEIGIKTIYLNPIFNAASNHKYDASDYSRIDAMFGSGGQFRQLAKEAKERGMTIILDGVFNHVGDDSIYFDRYGKFFNNLAYWGNDEKARNQNIGAYQAWRMKNRDKLSAEEQAEVPAWDPAIHHSPYEEWFDIKPDGSYEGWWGYDSLPVIKSVNGSELNAGGKTGLNFGDYIIRNNESIARQWVKMGSSGWRLDVSPEVADNFWREFRSYLKGIDKDTPGKLKFPNGEPIMLAENWGDASHDFLGDKFDSTMNYRFRNAVIDFMLDQPFNDTDINHSPINAQELDVRLTEIYEDYPKEAFYALMNLMGSHDTMRIKRVYGDLEPGVMHPDKFKGLTPEQIQARNQSANDRLKLTWILQMGYPGAPTTYYGDEMGMTGYDDPDDRRSVQWDKIDKPLLEFYKKLTAIRNQNQILKTGDLKTLYADQKTYAIGRSLVGDKDALGRTEYITNYDTNEKIRIKDVNGKAIVLINKDQEKTVEIDVSQFARDGLVFVDELNNRKEYTVTGGKLTVQAGGMHGSILIAKKGQDLLPPQQISDLKAAVDTENTKKVNLTWTAVKDAVRYTIYRSTVAGGSYERVANVNTTVYSEQPIEPGQAYTYVIVAVDEAGNQSVYSNEATAVPYAQVGWAGNLTGKNTDHMIGYTNAITDAGLEIWVDGITNQAGPAQNLVVEFGYGQIQDRSDWTWTAATFAGEAGNNDKYAGTFTPDRVGTWYYGFRFSTKGLSTTNTDWVIPSQTQYGSKDGKDDVRSVPVIANTDTTAPPAPTSSHKGVQNTRVTLEWAVPAKDDIVAFHVVRQAAGETSFREVARVGAEAASFVDTTVVNGTAYEYKVVAVDAAYNRTDSNTVSITPNVVPVKVTFRVTVPYYTGTNFPVHVAGEFPGAAWNPGASDYQFEYKGNDIWEKTVTLEEGMQIQYKYARGSWDRVEKDGNGQEVYNRLLVVRDSGNGTMVVQDTVARWRDMNLVVTEPASGTVTTSAEIAVKGNTIPNSRVTVNNVAVTATDNGDFSTIVPLQPGINQITVHFTAEGFSTETKKITVTRQ